jgi:2-C-methyl-D-erythritol 4-phosphate cytidylyltransferase
MQCFVIIPGGGSGSRFGGDLPKQYLPLAGKPIIQHTIERFLAEPSVARIIVCVASQFMQLLEEMRERNRWKIVSVVEGGASRQQSVHKGLLAAERDPRGLVAVHDAVRPFLRSNTFQTVLRAADEYGAAIPVGHLNDTIHRVKDGFVAETPDRSEWFAAQTPQCFRVSILRRALDEAARLRLDLTDEASAVSRTGVAVRVVPGDPLNFKITREDDLRIAEANFGQWSAKG